MQIRVNRNIDSYRPDIFHGLDFSQTIHAFATVVSGASAFLFLNLYLELPQTACFYLAMPFALPFALAGFLKIKGMAPAEYLKKRKEIRRMEVYFYCPECLSESFLRNTSEHMDVSEKAKEGKGDRKISLYLDNPDENGGENAL